MIYKPRLELAIGADLSAAPWSWTWLDMADPANWDPDGLPPGAKGRLLEQGLNLPVGKQGEASQVAPSTITVPLQNGDGWLTVGHPLSPWYGLWDTGTPGRFSMYAGSPYLLTKGVAGSRAGTPDHADLDITADWTYIVELLPPFWLPDVGLNFELVGKRVLTADQRTTLLMLGADGVLRLKWSTDGTAAGEHEAPSSEPIPRPEAGPLTLAVWLDVNNGAGGHNVHFYALPGGTRDDFLADPAAAELGTAFADTGATSVFSSSAPLEIGDVAGTGFRAYPGQYRRLQVRAGDPFTGAIRTNPDFTLMQPGDTSVVDSTGKTWTVQGTAEVTNAQVRLTGRVDAIRPLQPQGKVTGTARVQVTISDALRRMSQGKANKPIESPLRRRIMDVRNDDNRLGYWPCEDGSNATTAASPMAGVDPMGVAGFSFAAGDNIAGASKPLMHIAAGQLGTWYAVLPSGGPTDSWAAEVFNNLPVPETDPTRTRLFAVLTTGSIRRWDVLISDTTTEVIATDQFGGTLLDNLSSPVPGFFDQPTYVRLDLEQNGGNVDWALSYVPLDRSGTVVGTSASLAGTLGACTVITNQAVGPPTSGLTQGHVLVSHGLALGHLALAETAYAGEKFGRRALRLGDENGFPVTVTGDPDDGPPLGAQPIDSVLGILNDAALVEGGIVAGSRWDPRGVHCRTGRSRYNQTAKLVIDAGLRNPYQPVRDDRLVVNEAIVKRPDGSEATYSDDDHIDKKDLFDQDYTRNVDTDEQLPDQASWIVHLGTWPEHRVPSVPFSLAAAPDLIDQWTWLEPGDKVRVENLPAEQPTQEIEQLAEGWTETISGEGWDPAVVGQPAGPWEIGVLADDDAIDTDLARVDTDGSQLAAALDDNDTSFDVASTVGRYRWMTTTSSPDDFPIDVTFGGEVVNVSAIAASTITFGAAGTAAHAVNASVTPGLPASTAAGDLLLCLAAIRNSGTGIPNTPTGYTRLPVFSADSNAQLFAKVAGASEAAPTVSFAGGAANQDTTAQMARLVGKWHDPANIVIAAEERLVSPTVAQDIAYPALNVYVRDCIILYLGWKQDDWTSVATIAGATEIGEPDTTTGDDQGVAWDYVIQTASADIPAGVFTVTGGANTITRAAVVALACDKQTFTATRSANGVQKSHTAGTPVDVADPFVLGL